MSGSTTVLFDGRGLSDVTGVGNLTRGIYQSWKAHGAFSIASVTPLTWPTSALRRIEFASKLVVRRPTDWIFVPRLAPVPSISKRMALIIHDLGSVDLPSDYNALSVREQKALARADLIFTISEFTASRVLAIRPQARVVALPLGASDWVERKLPKSYLLCVAADRPNKKLRKLLEAWQLSGLALQNWNLVIVSGLRGVPVPEGVRVVGGLANAEVDALFEECAGYINVSTYEGLGLPVFQAIASKIPLLATDLPTYSKHLSPESSMPPEISSDDLAQRLAHFVADIAGGQDASYYPRNADSSRTVWRDVVTTIEGAMQ